MSRLYEALRRVELQKRQAGDFAIEPAGRLKF